MAHDLLETPHAPEASGNDGGGILPPRAEVVNGGEDDRHIDAAQMLAKALRRGDPDLAVEFIGVMRGGLSDNELLGLGLVATWNDIVHDAA